MTITLAEIHTLIQNFLAVWGDPILSALRLATPLIFAALGGILSERSGVINIALEGKMLIGAFMGAATALYFSNPWAGFLGAALAAGVMGLGYAFMTVGCKADQIIAGTAINMLAYGLTPFLAKLFFDVTGSSPPLLLQARFTFEPIPLALGTAVFLALFLRLTRGGLWLSMAGEHPEALEAAGVSVRRVRAAAVVAGSALAGIGGACLSLFLSSGYSRNMTAGRGFMALAALILGKWNPLLALVACLFLGAADSMQIRLQGISLPNGLVLPASFIQMLPYVATLILVAGFLGRSRAPQALGKK